MKRRLQSSGMPFEARQVPGGELWQIFVNDPNGVMIELNYGATPGAGRAGRGPVTSRDHVRKLAFGWDRFMHRDQKSRRRFRVKGRLWSEESAARETGFSFDWIRTEGFRRYSLSVTQQQVLDALGKVRSPGGVALPDANVLSAISVSDGKVFLSINVDAAQAREWESVRAQAEAAVRAIAEVKVAMVALTAERKAVSSPAPAAASPQSRGVPHVSAHRPPQGAASPMAERAEIPGVAAVIAVASGKGGVGKSTTALNIALGLRDLGLRVGLLDADIYGPSVPRLTGIHEKPQLNDDRKMIGYDGFGLAIMSIGFLVEEDTAMIWRGPMVMSAITQMLRDVTWGMLDVLVVDMPPGTGDAQLTLAQNVPLKGAIIISTPQDLSLIDARRGLAMFKRSMCRCSVSSRI